MLTGVRYSLSQLPSKRFTAHRALTQILADDSEDIDASDYGNDSYLGSEISEDSCHDSDSKPMATQPHACQSSRGAIPCQINHFWHFLGRPISDLAQILNVNSHPWEKQLCQFLEKSVKYFSSYSPPKN